MTVRDYIENVIQPKLQGDGGWIEYGEENGDELTVVFRGECSKCLILHRCVAWLESQILNDLGQQVHIRAVRKRPYFQDV